MRPIPIGKHVIFGMPYEIKKVKQPIDSEGNETDATVDMGDMVIEITKDKSDKYDWLLLLHEVSHVADPEGELTEAQIWNQAYAHFSILHSAGILK